MHAGNAYYSLFIEDVVTGSTNHKVSKHSTRTHALDRKKIRKVQLRHQFFALIEKYRNNKTFGGSFQGMRAVDGKL